jgi:hypothetical protein
VWQAAASQVCPWKRSSASWLNEQEKRKIRTCS